MEQIPPSLWHNNKLTEFESTIAAVQPIFVSHNISHKMCTVGFQILTHINGTPGIFTNLKKSNPNPTIKQHITHKWLIAVPHKHQNDKIPNTPSIFKKQKER